jgi:hypothetical protein
MVICGYFRTDVGVRFFISFLISGTLIETLEDAQLVRKLPAFMGPMFHHHIHKIPLLEHISFTSILILFFRPRPGFLYALLSFSD